MRVTVESFESSKTSMIVREADESAAVTMRWRPRSVIETGALVVSKTMTSAASPLTTFSFSGAVKCAMPPKLLETK
jgi:hypothetical protein